MNRAKAIASACTPTRRSREGGAEMPTDKAVSQLLELLSRAVERAQRGEPQVVSDDPDPVKVWKDDDYDYLEAEIAGVDPKVEADLFLGNGIVFVRIKRAEAQKPVISLPRGLNRRRA